MQNEKTQLVLLFIAIAVPLLLFKLGKHRILLAWIAVTLFVQIFDTAILTNLPAGRIVGLLYLPAALLRLREWIHLRPVKAWLLNYGYLLILALIFGFLWPWPDSTLMRPFALTAQGKALIYPARLLADFSLSIYVAIQLCEQGMLTWLARAMVMGATASASFAILFMVTGFDITRLLFKPDGAVVFDNRAHGLSAEPRDMGLACVYGIMILLVGQRKLFRFWGIALAVNLLGLLGTVSTSALALLASGILAGWIFFTNATRQAILFFVIGGTLLIFAISVTWPAEMKTASQIIAARIAPDIKLMGIPPGTPAEEIAYRLDVFDASALLFLLNEPLYALIGTGPGMIPLPASFHVPPGLYSEIWRPEVGVNSPPFHGLLLEVSNSGVIGLGLWCFQVLTCLGALRWLARNRGLLGLTNEQQLTWAIFLLGAIFYLVQVSISPVWAVMLGVGWSAYGLAREYGYAPAKPKVYIPYADVASYRT